MRPARTPIGLELARAARTVSRAFDDALAEAVGVREATLTHHLNAMDAQGLVTRTRDPANRRVHVVALTPAGEAAFIRLAEAATAFDRRLRDGFTDTDLDGLSALLGRLASNVADEQVPAGPWAD